MNATIDPDSMTFRPGRLVAAGVAAGLLLISGVGVMIGASIHHGRRLAGMAETLEQLERLDRLEAEAAVTRAIIAAWEPSSSQPPAWRGMLRELGLDEATEIRESEPAMALAGWTLRRADLIAAALSLADLHRVVQRAHAAPHPWCLREVVITAGTDAPATLSMRLRFETPVHETY